VHVSIIARLVGNDTLSHDLALKHGLMLCRSSSLARHRGGNACARIRRCSVACYANGTGMAVIGSLLVLSRACRCTRVAII